MGKLNKNSSIALYQQLIEEIQDMIFQGKLMEGDRLMTEAELSETYEVSRITVRKAIEYLVEEGILVKRQGIGTFVAQKRLKRNMDVFMGFTRSCELDGKKPGTTLLCAELSRPDSKDRERLKLHGSEKILKIRRVRLTDDVPVIIEENHFPQKYAFLLEEDLEKSLYQMLAEHGVTMGGGNRRISLCTATEEEASILGVKTGDPLLFMQDWCVSSDGEPVHSCKSVINPQRYVIEINTVPETV